MPSQSRLDGESTPDHSIRTESPDLETTFGVTDKDTLDANANRSKKIRRRRRRRRRQIMVESTIEDCR